MKVKSIILENYRSFGKNNNRLEVEEINTIVGKNESGKSNLISGIEKIKLLGMDKDDFFLERNKNYNLTPKAYVELLPYKEEKNTYTSDLSTKLIINGRYDTNVSGGISEIIKNNEEFQEKRKKINEIVEESNIKNYGSFNKIIEMINSAEIELFIDFPYVNETLSSMGEVNDEYYKQAAKYARDCVNYLNKLNALLPEFISLDDIQLKTKYTRRSIENEENKALKYLLKDIKMNVDELKQYWILESDDKINFEIDFNDKLSELIQKFNVFYRQEEVKLRAGFDSDSISFAISTNSKYINLSERSNGLKWYLNMFIQLYGKTQTDDIKNYVILLDEPGVYLHINAQKELLKLFEEFAKQNNQIIYTTHSPFMIYDEKIERTRLIVKDEAGNSNISNKFYSLPQGVTSVGATETLSPLMISIGMNMSYDILGKVNCKTNIVTEGISDYFYIKGYYVIKKSEIPNIIPSVSANNINNLISIFIGWGCKYKVILNQDNTGRKEYRRIVEKLKISKNDVIFTDGNRETINGKIFTIEDVFSEDDKNKIGITKTDYKDEKAYYALSTLKKIENGEYTYDKETMHNFDKIIDELFKNN